MTHYRGRGHHGPKPLATNKGISTEYFKRMGLISLRELWIKLEYLTNVKVST